MIHPNTQLQFISREKGYGVVALDFIPKGTITWVLDPLDHVFTAEQKDALPDFFRELLNTYSYRDATGDFVLCWDHARFVNHSFHSNCISTAYNFELAVRDIHPGEELTDDYGYLNVSEPWPCLPEPNTTRTMVMPDDLLHFHDEWDDQLREAFKHFRNVNQPLFEFIEQRYKRKVMDIAAGKAVMDSIINCYYSGQKKAAAA